MSIEIDQEYGPPEIGANEITVYSDMLLGSGTFADVYAGKCRSLDVAVKRLKNQDVTEEELETFREEIRLMRQLNHPHVVLYLGACTEPGNLAIITEHMENDLSSLLRDKHVHLSLFQKLKIAKECALGMSWLHGSQKPIIHYDLKPSNFLIDVEGRVKVSDFGLSISKPKGELIRTEPRGTAVYMAPEVFDGDDHDEKCDIYSYGVILWEIYTRRLPYEELLDEITVYELCERVADEGLRLPIPEDCPPALAELIVACWDHYPDDRPSFSEILEKLDSIIAEEAIIDTTGRIFWKRFFKNYEKIQWETFISEFCRYFNYNYQHDADPTIRCLRVLFAGGENQNYVTVENFGRMLDYFGPIMKNGTKVSFLRDLMALISEKWFFGFINTEDSNAILREQPPGSFLVRFSNSNRGYLTVSQIIEEGTEKKIRHTRVRHAPLSSEYMYQGYTYPSLQALVESQRTISDLRFPCSSGSYFSYILGPVIVSAYIDVD
eukprot:TRINITY_DN11757_c0_g1_i1.p1 TRINITY_DN11757_c0_g1~~TRINITY_DN11757_c0_g1_i1.p1  ORF type:complete len:493 (-),score=82.30 TRINITY_DN11757_c0_g1_i1:49-1527(-)